VESDGWRGESVVIELRIDGKKVAARQGDSLLDVARREGFDIPTLCQHEALTPYGACRICLVEVTKPGRTGRITTACNHPALPNLDVDLETERVVKVRRLALELLLAHAPDASGIKDLARRYGVESTRFERVDAPKDCILCGLCERVCREVVGVCAFSLCGRGNRRMIGPPFGRDVLCIGCGACEALCPTGVLGELRTAALERYRSLHGEDRLCRYALMGLIPAALCANDFRCERCETEHALVEEAGDCEHPLLRAGVDEQREVLR
jgi:NADH dehydrogenase/NADH:ubiquinone oxidoreductase subunit G